MTLVVPNSGEALILEVLVNKSAQENLRLKLFSNNLTPVEATVIGDFTEASGSGYADKLLTGATWNAAVLGAPSYITYPAQTFTFSGALGNVYGYYIVGNTSAALYWAERFTSAPINIASAADTITITPRLEAS